MRNTDEISGTTEGDVQNNAETCPSVRDDHSMSGDEFELMKAQLAKQTAQNEKHKFQSLAAGFGERTDSTAADPYLKEAELLCGEAEAIAKIKEYLFSLPVGERQEAEARAQREGYPLHLYVSDDELEGTTIVEGPPTLQ